jgi:enediyne biosynthesis protein CalE5
MSRIDDQRYKNGQRADWNSAAAGWDKWVEIFEQGGRTLSDRMVEIAGIAPGHRVLDIATGPGDPGLTAAERVGADGHVALTDISSEMLDIARKRARHAGLGHVSFHETDAETLSVGGEPFDAVLSRWGFMFFPDRPAALKAVKSHLEPGGRFVAAVWGPPPKAPLISTPPIVIMKALEILPPPAGTPGIFGLADPTPFVRELEAEGFSDIELEEHELVFPFESPGSYVSFMQDIAAPINALLAGETEERRHQLWGMVEDAVAALADSSGRLTATNMSIVISATA